MIIEDIEQGTEEWLELRRGKITASRIKEVLAKGRGNAPSKTRQSYMYQLIAERLTGEIEDSYTNKYMEWGNEWEPSARAAYQLKNDLMVRQVAFVKLNDDIGVSPDGLVEGNGLLEIKCPKTTTHIDWYLKGKCPSEHYPQVQAQMWVAGSDWCDFVSFDPRIDGDSGYFEVRVPRDDEYIDHLKYECGLFIEEMNEIMEKLK